MPREYRNIKNRKELFFALRENGKMNREICEKFGLKQRQLERKEQQIKRLEMGNELMWDFLSLTERK